MRLSIYKYGQGYWTRMLSAVGFGTIVVAGVFWLVAELQNIRDQQTMRLTQSIVAISIISVTGALGWFLLNKPRIVDFLIATEAEMRKVNWPSRNEIIGSTWIVICGTFLMALFLWTINMVFSFVFIRIGVLA